MSKPPKPQSNFNHSFNVKIAIAYGPENAIMLDNIAYWTRHNIASRINYHDERYWTYNSTRAYSELFPYWSERQIERIMNNLLKLGLITKGNYNQLAYDRTSWYALSDLGLEIMEIHVIRPEASIQAISPNGEMDFTKHVNGFTQTVEPIPNTLTNTLTNKRSIRATVDKSVIPETVPTVKSSQSRFATLLTIEEKEVRDLIMGSLGPRACTHKQAKEIAAKTKGNIPSIKKSLECCLEHCKDNPQIKNKVGLFHKKMLELGYYPDEKVYTVEKKVIRKPIADASILVKDLLFNLKQRTQNTENHMSGENPNEQ